MQYLNRLDVDSQRGACHHIGACLRHKSKLEFQTFLENFSNFWVSML